jgi:sulfate transport system ATP-binding protein
LDEPLSALDRRLRQDMQVELRRIQRESGLTTIFVTHDQEEALELADSIVIMDKGRVEQTAAPRQLYDEPTNEFVMSFVGPVNKLGDAWVRPHDVALGHEPNGSTQEAQVERIVRLGFEIRVELVRDDGARLCAQLTRDEADELELAQGDIVYVSTRKERTFSA